ncbi:dihydrofolate reductase family protein [Thermostaphylospora chromogena]
MTRPYVLLSAAVSIDGRIDDASPRRLVLSSPADLDRVDEVRAGCDAILVGAETLRRDDPRLMIRDASRRAARTERGDPEQPIGVVLTAGGDLDPTLRFWRRDGGRLVYTTDAGAARLAGTVGASGTDVTVIGMGAEVRLPAVLDDLGARGVRRLMVEGGGRVHTAFLAQGLADELHLAVAPLLVGQADAPPFLHPAPFPGGPGRRLRLLDATTVGDVVLIRYAVPRVPETAPPEESVETGLALRQEEPAEEARRGTEDGLARSEARGGRREVSDADLRWLRLATDLARLCPPSRTAFSVGAVIVDAEGREISRGHSRESDPHEHAEEAALAKLPPGDPRLPGATLYSSLEPCCRRSSRPRPCAQLILEAGIRRVVIAWREPDTFVSDCQGSDVLTEAGVEVVEIPELAQAARAPNAHLPL